MRASRQKLSTSVKNPVRKGLVTSPEDYPWLWLASSGEALIGNCHSRGRLCHANVALRHSLQLSSHRL